MRFKQAANGSQEYLLPFFIVVLPCILNVIRNAANLKAAASLDYNSFSNSLCSSARTSRKGRNKVSQIIKRNHGRVELLLHREKNSSVAGMISTN